MPRASNTSDLVSISTLEGAIRVKLGPTAAVKHTVPCPCCDAVIVYARDEHALWLAPQVTDDGNPILVLAISTAETLESFLRMLALFDPADHGDDDLGAVRAATVVELRNAFHRREPN